METLDDNEHVSLSNGTFKRLLGDLYAIQYFTNVDIGHGNFSEPYRRAGELIDLLAKELGVTIVGGRDQFGEWKADVLKAWSER